MRWLVWTTYNFFKERYWFTMQIIVHFSIDLLCKLLEGQVANHHKLLYDKHDQLSSSFLKIFSAFKCIEMTYIETISCNSPPPHALISIFFFVLH